MLPSTQLYTIDEDCPSMLNKRFIEEESTQLRMEDIASITSGDIGLEYEQFKLENEIKLNRNFKRKAKKSKKKKSASSKREIIPGKYIDPHTIK